MGIASMRVHRLVSLHFPRLFDDLEWPTSSSPISLDPEGLIHIDEVTTKIECTCVHRNPTNGVSKTTTVEGTHWSVPVRTPISIQYVLEASESFD